VRRAWNGKASRQCIGKYSVGGRVPPSHPFLERMVANSSLISDLVDDVESVCFSIFKRESASMFDQLLYRSDAFNSPAGLLNEGIGPQNTFWIEMLSR
jgi:hypothetical protein